MNEVLWVRNPETGLTEVKEFAGDAGLATLRISDPVLTQIAQGYTNAAFQGDKLFPVVRTDKRTGRFPVFGKEAFVIPTNLKRGVGERVQRMLSTTGYILAELDEYALGFGIENSERTEWAGSPDQLLNLRLGQAQDKIALVREQNQATLATTYGNYASGFSASGAGYKWATDGDPVVDMRAAAITVSKSNGKRPNVAWFTPTAWESFINNKQVLDRVRWGGNNVTPAQITKAAAAALLQVDEVVVFEAVYGAGGDGGVKKSALTMNWLWESVGGACAGLAIVGTGYGIPSFGYTYEQKNSPVMESYYENQTKSQIYDAQRIFSSAITLTSAGYLIYGVA